MKIQIQDKDKPKQRNGLIVAMQRRGNGRHARGFVMRDRRKRRQKDARNHWSKEWE